MRLSGRRDTGRDGELWREHRELASTDNDQYNDQSALADVPG